MRRFHCQCGAQLFFENHRCLKCGLDVGFDPQLMIMVPVDGETLFTAGTGAITVSAIGFALAIIAITSARDVSSIAQFQI